MYLDSKPRTEYFVNQLTIVELILKSKYSVSNTKNTCCKRKTNKEMTFDHEKKKRASTCAKTKSHHSMLELCEAESWWLNGTGDSRINYNYLTECTWIADHHLWGAMVLGGWLVILLYFLSTTADSFFCPCLQVCIIINIIVS